MSDSTQLGRLQLEIMRVLWAHGEATVASVHEALSETRGLAPTTIATMLKKMEHKGVVRHRTEGRKFIYAPTVSEGAVTRSMVADLADRLFGGDATALVNHVLSEHEVDPEELDELKRRIAAARRRGK